jgi:hypothetical protein
MIIERIEVTTARQHRRKAMKIAVSPERPNRLFDTDAELASLSLTLEPNGESDQWGNN